MTFLADGFQASIFCAGMFVESEKLFLHPTYLSILVVEDRLLKEEPK